MQPFWWTLAAFPAPLPKQTECAKGNQSHRFRSVKTIKVTPDISRHVKSNRAHSNIPIKSGYNDMKSGHRKWMTEPDQNLHCTNPTTNMIQPVHIYLRNWQFTFRYIGIFGALLFPMKSPWSHSSVKSHNQHVWTHSCAPLAYFISKHITVTNCTNLLYTLLTNVCCIEPNVDIKSKYFHCKHNFLIMPNIHIEIQIKLLDVIMKNNNRNKKKSNRIVGKMTHRYVFRRLYSKFSIFIEMPAEVKALRHWSVSAKKMKCWSDKCAYLHTYVQLTVVSYAAWVY